MSDPDTQYPTPTEPDGAPAEPDGTPVENPSGEADAQTDGDTASGGAPEPA